MEFLHNYCRDEKTHHEQPKNFGLHFKCRGLQSISPYLVIFSIFVVRALSSCNLNSSWTMLSEHVLAGSSVPCRADGILRTNCGAFISVLSLSLR